MPAQVTPTIKALWSEALAHSQAGRPGEAEGAFRLFLRLAPDHPGAHFNLAVTLKALGRLDEAATHYRRALALRPGDAKAHNNLAVILARLDQTQAALDHYRRALAIQPDYANAHYNYANALRETGDTGLAIVHYRRALLATPNDADAYTNLGLALAAEGRLDEAIAQHRHALTLKPEDAGAHSNLGSALDAHGRFDEAEASYRRALARDPAHADAHYNLGRALDAQDRPDEAEGHYELALALNPRRAEAHNNFGLLLQRRGRWAEALARFEHARTLKPDDAEAHWNEALARLRLGDFDAGWREYEWRWRRKETPPRAFAAPPWDGAALAGRTILLHAEQGQGDAIQFVRYAQRVQALGARVVLECPRPLRRLFHRVDGVDQLVCTGDILPSFDVHAPLLSLPRLLGAPVPSPVPSPAPSASARAYLTAEAGAAETWRRRLDGHAGRRIGLAWRGNAAHGEDRRRSIGASVIAPLTRSIPAAWVGLQVDARAEELAAFSPAALRDAGPMLDDWAETAALISTLDLVVTVDTAVAHLAGALGKPVWVLLAFTPDWRWLLERDDSPWYPTMRLFRQPTPGDWASVMDQVAAALAEPDTARAGAVRPIPPAGRPPAPRLPPAMVISHERSGTHFLMNALSYTYGYTADPWIDLDRHNAAVDLSSPHRTAASLEALAPDPLCRIVKSHHAAEVFGEALDRVSETFTVFYIYRDPVAVMTSLWRHLNGLEWDEGPRRADPLALARAAPAGPLTRYQGAPHATLLLRWAAHIEGWLSRARLDPRIIPVRYEDLDSEYETTMAALSGATGRAPLAPLLRPPRDVNVIATHRPGSAAPATPEVREALGAYCQAEVGPLMQRLGYGSHPLQS